MYLPIFYSQDATEAVKNVVTGRRKHRVAFFFFPVITYKIPSEENGPLERKHTE